jgi:hypothetical protein
VGRVSVCLFGLDIRVELPRVHSKELGLFSFTVSERSIPGTIWALLQDESGRARGCGGGDLAAGPFLRPWRWRDFGSLATSWLHRGGWLRSAAAGESL